MVSVFDSNPSEVIAKAAKKLQEDSTIVMPEWAKVVKTGPGQERLPDSLDWWYFRLASVLRKVYVQGPIGVSKLRNFYGKKKNRGTKPEKFYKASGKIIRTALQQLETAGYVVQAEKGVHKGRIVTPKGRSFLDTVCKKEKKNE